MTLTPEQQATLDQLTAKIVAAVPDGDWIVGSFGPVDGPQQDIRRPITLEDVLRAIQESKKAFPGLFEFALGAYGWFTFQYDGDLIGWKLGSPLQQQTPNVHAFLNNLLS